MNKMLIDTSGFFSLYDAADKYNYSAISLYDSSNKKLTTSYVLAEFTALAQIRGVKRSEIIKFSVKVLEDAEIEIVWINETLHRRAVVLMQEREDKNYSLCDAVSFVVMRERGITEALTTDKHFEQESFVRLLKS